MTTVLPKTPSARALDTLAKTFERTDLNASEKTAAAKEQIDNFISGPKPQAASNAQRLLGRTLDLPQPPAGFARFVGRGVEASAADKLPSFPDALHYARDPSEGTVELLVGIMRAGCEDTEDPSDAATDDLATHIGRMMLHASTYQPVELDVDEAREALTTLLADYSIRLYAALSFAGTLSAGTLRQLAGAEPGPAALAELQRNSETLGKTNSAYVQKVMDKARAYCFERIDQVFEANKQARYKGLAESSMSLMGLRSGGEDLEQLLADSADVDPDEAANRFLRIFAQTHGEPSAAFTEGFRQGMNAFR